MSAEQSLVKYHAAVQALKDHQEANKAVFDEHKRFLLAVIDAENALQDAVAEEKQGVSDNMFEVTYTPQTQTIGDVGEIDNLLNQGIITKEIREKIVKTFDRPPRIVVKEKNPAA